MCRNEVQKWLSRHCFQMLSAQVPGLKTRNSPKPSVDLQLIGSQTLQRLHPYLETRSELNLPILSQHSALPSESAGSKAD
ncbi:hypothetical protein NPIL_422021 [Nephila pilipes]|uniref:Uncharacterized protein n=1 Tax=Nephila pilipes TaxID=299642 RepID=A0A8X6MCA9_NEPPI|nr:hypothetical protein NPIL_422021 [Nephila pilipes]